MLANLVGALLCSLGLHRRQVMRARAGRLPFCGRCGVPLLVVR